MSVVYDVVQIAQTVRDVAEQFSSVIAVYLFGSVCTGRHGALSDIDIALMVDPSFSVNVVCGDVQDELCRRLKTDKIDLVLLAQAPSALGYRVIKDGRCIYCRDKRAVESFESLTVMKYLDFKPVRDRAFEIARAKTLEAA